MSQQSEAFVANLYQTLLFRAPDAGGLSYWSSQLDNGTLSQTQVVEKFIDSPEYLSTSTPVEQLYDTTFNRMPSAATDNDPSGINYWVNQMHSLEQGGASPDQAMLSLAAQFSSVPELSSLNNQQYVEQLYKNALHDPATDPTGVAYWVNQLNQGLSRAQFMVDVARSPEHQLSNQDAPPNNDTDINTTLLYGSLQNAKASTDAMTQARTESTETVINELLAGVTLTQSATSVKEGDSLTFTVTPVAPLKADTTFLFSVNGDTLGGTVAPATASDFAPPIGGTVTFKAGATDAQTVTVSPVQDNITEGLEGFKFSLLNSTNQLVASSTATIIDVPADTQAPVVASGQTIKYNEGSAAGTVLGTVQANDNVGVTQFTIASGNDQGFYQIDNTGKISLTDAGVKSPADNAETLPNQFVLGVTAADAAGNVSAPTNVALAVQDTTPPAPLTATQAGTTALVNFTEILNPASVPVPSAFTVVAGGTNIAVNSVTVDGTTAKLALATAVTGAAAVTYTPPATNPLEDRAGQDVVAFTKDLVADNAPPTVASTSPADNATDVSITSPIALTFSEPIQKGTGNIILTNEGNAGATQTIAVTDATQVKLDGSTLIVTPNTSLSANAHYDVQIAAGAVTDLAGNPYAGINDKTTYDFQTAPPPPATTLTVNQDTLSGTTFFAPLFTSPSTGAQIQTLTSVDQLTGTGVGSQLTAILNFTEVFTAPTLTKVGTVDLTVIGASVFDAINVTGTTKYIDDSSQANLTIRDIGAPATIAMVNTKAGVGVSLQAQFANTLTATAADIAAIELNGVGQGAIPALNTQILNVRGQTAGGFETFAINAIGAPSELAQIGSDPTVIVGAPITKANSTLNTVDVTGNANLRIDGTLFNVKTVDASGTTPYTGNLHVKLDSLDVTVKGGTGNDFFDFVTTPPGADDTLNNNDTVNGGDGRDTLQVNTNTGLGAGNHISSIEILRVENPAPLSDTALKQTYDLSQVPSIDAIVHNAAGAFGITYSNVPKAGAADPTKGVTILNIEPITVNVKDATTSATDVLALHIGQTGTAATDGSSALQTLAGVPTGTITTQGIETINLDVRVDDAGNTAGGTGTITDIALQALNITGGAANHAFAILAGSFAGTTNLTSIDAHSFAGNLTVAGTATGQSIIGGSGNDKDAAGTLGLETGGRPAYVAGGTAAADALTGGAGHDTFVFEGGTGATDDGNLTAANVNDAFIPVNLAATHLRSIATITDLNLGTNAAAGQVDTIHFAAGAGGAGTLGTVALGGFTVVNGGTPTALTGADIGTALNNITGAAGVLTTGIATAGAAGLFTWSGETFLVATSNTAAAGHGFGAAPGVDIIIHTTGATGTLDASDFT